MLPQTRWLGVLVWCACHHQDFADLQAIVDSGRGDVPLIHLRFRCTNRAHHFRQRSSRTELSATSMISFRPRRSTACDAQ
jgi:hypothetical protein